MNRLLSGRARVLLVTMLSAALGITGLGTMPGASAAPAAQIVGTVTDADGAGIKGIEVTAYEFDGVDGRTPIASTTTKDDGGYLLKKLPAATYQVEFRDDAGTYVDEYYDDQPSIDLADGVPVAQGQTVAGIDAELARTGSIRGTVTDEQGQPVPGIFVDVYTFDEDGFPTGSPNGGTTNDNGIYVVPFIAPGEYAVGFVDLDGTYVNEYYDDHLSIFDSDLVAVTPAGVTTGIDAELAPGGSISGTVTDSGGGPVAGVEIDLARLVDGEWFSFGEEFGFQTQDDGTYDVSGLPAGTWQVGFIDRGGNYLSEYYDDQPTFDTATNLDLSPGGTLSGIDAVLDPAGHVEGTVTDEEGTPLVDVDVTAWVPADDGHWEFVSDAETDADGTYSMGGLPAGTYRIQFQDFTGDHAAEFYDDVLAIEDAAPVVLALGATVQDIDAELADAARITGTVTGPDGQPFEIVGVVAWRLDGTIWEEFNIGFTESSTDGRYSVDSLIPGTYRLEFDAFTTPDGGHEFWDDQPSLELAQDIVVTDKGQVLEGYDAVLEEGQYPFEVENLTAPSISGSPVVGQTLTATPGAWNLAATTFHYQWWAGTTPVGTDLPTYSPTAADVGKAITVTVVGSLAGLGSAAATSAPTAVVTGGAAQQQQPPPPSAALHVVNLELPLIKGTLEVGRRARVTPGRWNPADVTLTYQWFVGGKRIVKADKRKVTLKEKWVGKRLKVVVVAKAGGYLATKVTTQRSSKIKP